jgi:hypothetical protein
VRGWLLVTNVLSELRRPRPDPLVIAFVAAQPAPRLYVSTVTFAEIRFGIEAIGDPERRTQLNAWLAHDLRPLFEGRVVPITEDVLLRWRQVVEAGRRRRHTYEPDVLIAAAALVEQLAVVSATSASSSRLGCRCSTLGPRYSSIQASRKRNSKPSTVRTSST